MLISGREAVRILLTRGAMTGEAQARALLRSGAAGPGIVTGPGVLFDQDHVRALADRPWLDASAQEDACPQGVYLARISRTALIDLTRPWPDVAAQLDHVPPMPVMTTALLELRVRASARFPWVATMHGFVVFGADLTGLETLEAGGLRFCLEPPGEWFASWRGRRLESPRGGRPWVIQRGVIRPARVS